MWIIKVALDRPYTVIVLALLILLLSPVIILNAPTDIVPNIDIPVVGVGWVYTGLSPQEPEGRLTSVYERLVTATVDNIEHIESNTVNGQVIVKVFLQPGTNIAVANAQVTASSQTILRQLPPGTLPPIILNYSASTVPILQLALPGNGLSEQQLNDLAIRVVGNSTTYLRDVAQVSDGFAPQTNIVRQDGHRGTLLSVLKSGNASTISVVARVRQMLPAIATTLPPALKIQPLADQSVFVASAVSGVVREAIIAACLTGIMILVF